MQVKSTVENAPVEHSAVPGFIQARLCKIQGLFKDFSKPFLLFSGTEKLKKNTDFQFKILLL